MMQSFESDAHDVAIYLATQCLAHVQQFAMELGVEKATVELVGGHPIVQARPCTQGLIQCSKTGGSESDDAEAVRTSIRDSNIFWNNFASLVAGISLAVFGSIGVFFTVGLLINVFIIMNTAIVEQQRQYAAKE